MTQKRPTHERVQVLDADGRVREDATVPDVSDDRLTDMYYEMLLARRFDERAISLQRQGRLGTYPPLAGQEAAQIGSTHALADDDWILYQYREHGTVIARELSHEYLLYWMGHEVGNEWLASQNVFPINISIGSHLPHAAGMAWASKLKNEDRAFVCHFGDGATSEGDFHEALNFAGVFDVPAIFVCNNNQWAISTPRERQTASNTIAEKAQAYGFEGVQVDGMDPLAMYQVMTDAVEKALDPTAEERRPTLIEAVQYRFGAHTTADDPTVYRDDEERERWERRDPLARMETFLRDRGLLDDQHKENMETAIEELLNQLVEKAESYEPDPASMFDYSHAKAPPRVRAQREAFQQLREHHGDEALTRDD